jgi:hypothetical protein
MRPMLDGATRPSNVVKARGEGPEELPCGAAVEQDRDRL